MSCELREKQIVLSCVLFQGTIVVGLWELCEKQVGVEDLLTEGMKWRWSAWNGEQWGISRIQDVLQDGGGRVEWV